ncbi:MAG: helix-turn-helix transcriptional regulator [Phycisphaeraceae bacterium]|nr:helix-turn-helix transcriptional regulator [Phycisphaeraceae bacterium]
MGIPAHRRPLRSHDTGRCPLGAVTLAGMLDKHMPWQGFEAGLRVFGRFACVLLLKGAGRFQDDRGLDRAVSAGDLLLLFPDVGHRYGPNPGATWREMYLVFEGPVFDQWYARGLIAPSQPIHRVEPVDAWERRMRGVLSSEPSMSRQALGEVCRMQQLLSDMLTRPTVAESPSGDADWARQASRVISATIPGPVDWQAVSRKLRVSLSTLRRRMHEQFGVSPGQFRTRRMIELACDLMHRDDLTDKQIAGRLGFCDPFYFSRCFKQVTGLSPRRYRQGLP